VPSKPADHRFAIHLIKWFDAHARDLPWRTRTTNATPSGRDPYAALVAEVMLQQTQVGRVLEKLGPFLEAFPDVHTLAAADEADVLARWSGLGYYRRGRNLHRCAQTIVSDHGGAVPSDVRTLRTLPGIGAYTAGAIASIVFGAHEPTVDGNITRVLLRVDGVDHAHGSPEAADHAWARAADLVAATDRPGALNEALMELGATVCTPKSPSCDRCPRQSMCDAARTGRAASIPRPKARAAKRELFAWTVHAVRTNDAVLVRRRPDTGLWAGLWELPTFETDDDRPPAPLSGLPGGRPGPAFAFETTHRSVRFRVTELGPLRGGEADAVAALIPGSEWADRGEVLGRALSSPMSRLLKSTRAEGSLFA